MANIKIKDRKEILIVSNKVARQIKNRKFGCEGAVKANDSDLIDLGDAWSGNYSDVKWIEIDPLSKVSESPEPLTQIEIENVALLLKKYKPDFLKK